MIIPREEHSISRSAINRNALKVLYRLHEAGYGAYLVGGCVRDLLLGQKPKDFDVATDAHPEEIRKLFKNCRLIGRRFRLAHIFFGKEIIEVATFRTHHQNAEESHGKIHNGMIVRDNVYGTIEDDAWRRDFRMNALYYNIADFSIVDYTGGMKDIQHRMLHMIGEPEQRFHEDPVRLLRTIRFLAKLNINIGPETEEPLVRLSHLLSHVSSARLFQEVMKFLEEGSSLNTVKLLHQYHLFAQLFPLTAESFKNPQAKSFVELALANTDDRIKHGKSVSPAFLFAVFLWYPLLNEIKQMQSLRLPPLVMYERAIQQIVKQQTAKVAITRIMQATIRDICILQYRFNQRRGSQPHRLLNHPRFRAGYDLMLLRSQTGEIASELAEWWTQFQTASSEEREAMIKAVQHQNPPRKKKRPHPFKNKPKQ